MAARALIATHFEATLALPVPCAPPPSERAPVLLPQVAPRPPLLPPAAVPRSGLKGCPAAAAKSTSAPWGAAHELPAVTPSTAVSLATRTPSMSTVPSDDEQGDGTDRLWERALRGGGELARTLRVKNTFLEFPPRLHLEGGGESPRRALSAPPPGRAVGESQEAAASALPGEGRVAGVEGPARVPTLGSALHGSGRCKPCAFVHTKGCQSGEGCAFCHLCDPEEKKRRQRDRWESKRSIWRAFRKQGRRASAADRRLTSPAGRNMGAP